MKNSNTFNFMVRSKISGIVLSRHKTEELAMKFLQKNDTNKSPLYIAPYSENIYKQYIKPTRFISKKEIKG